MGSPSRVRSLVFVSVVMSMALGQTPPAGAQDFRVNTYTSGGQYVSRIATDALGSFVVVWNSGGQDGSDSGVFGQRYDASGAPLGGEFQVNVYTTGSQTQAAVAMDADGTFVVVWKDNGPEAGYQRGVFGRRYDAAGSPLGGDFQVGSATSYETPTVAFTQGGEFVVVMTEPDTYTTPNKILRGQRYDSSGTPVGSVFLVTPGYLNSEPQVASTTSGGFVVAWDRDDGNGNFDIFARRFDSTATPLGSEFMVNTATPDAQRFPGLAVQPDGAFMVVWSSQLTPSGPGVIKGRRYDSSGSPLGAEFVVSTSAIYDGFFGFPEGLVQPAAAARAGGGFLVTWWNTGQDGSGAGALGRSFDSAGEALGGEFLLNSDAAGNQFFARPARRPDGGFVATWTGQDGSSYGVFAHNKLLTGDPALRLSIADVIVTEGDAGTGTASFNVTLSAVGAQTVTVDFTTVDDTATAGSDYVAMSGTLTFPPGTTAQSIDVTVNGDLLDESTGTGPSERFLVNLSSPSVPVSDGQAQATLLNDDAAPGPGLDPVAGGAIVVGASNNLTGANFTAGTRIKLFVNTGASIDDVSGPGGFTPSAFTANTLTWDIPPTVALGQGFGSIFVVNTDEGFTTSDTQYARLYGDAADNLPTIREVGGMPLAAMLDPGVPVAHTDTVVPAGSTVTIGGTGFNNPGVNLFAATDAGADPSPTATPCAVANYGPFFPGGSSTSFQIDLTLSPVGPVPAGPANFQVVNDPYTGNVQSNSVSAVIAARPTITSVFVSGSEVQVFGTGFSCLSVINLFNLQGASVVNLGGLTGGGQRVIPLQFISSSELRFMRPAGAQAGPAFVEVLNPPYIPFSSSGNDPEGAFSFP